MLINDTSSNALDSKRSSTMMNKNLPKLTEKRLRLDDSKNSAVKIQQTFYIPASLNKQGAKLIENSVSQTTKEMKSSKLKEKSEKLVSIDVGRNQSFLSPQMKT